MTIEELRQLVEREHAQTGKDWKVARVSAPIDDAAASDLSRLGAKLSALELVLHWIGQA